jgi:hypothetical protein
VDVDVATEVLGLRIQDEVRQGLGLGRIGLGRCQPSW